MLNLGPDTNLLVEDAMWCWWTRPRATRIGNAVFFGAMDSLGHELAIRYDLKSGTSEKAILARFEDDDHNNPALVAVAGKPLIAFYSRHDAEEGLRYRISARPLDLSAWGEEQMLTFGGSTTYAEVHPRGNDLHLFTRVNETRWGYTSSTDWGKSWATPKDFLAFDTDQQVYMGTVLLPDGKTLRVGVSGHPKEYEKKPVHDVFACEVDLVTGAVTRPSDGKLLANLFTGANLPLDYRNLERVHATPAARTVNLIDVGDGPVFEIAFTSKIKDDHSNRDARYHVVALRDGGWRTEDVAMTGAKFGYIDAGFYVGGMAFPDRSPGGAVYITREENGLWSLEHRVRDAAGKWQPEVLIPPGPTRLSRPWALTDAPPGLPVVALALERYADDFSYFGSLSHLVAPRVQR